MSRLQSAGRMRRCCGKRLAEAIPQGSQHVKAFLSCGFAVHLAKMFVVLGHRAEFGQKISWSAASKSPGSLVLIFGCGQFKRVEHGS